MIRKYKPHFVICNVFQSTITLVFLSVNGCLFNICAGGTFYLQNKFSIRYALYDINI